MGSEKSGGVTVHHRQIWLQKEDPEIRLYYVESLPPSLSKTKGTILLIHGFPETSYQFRHVIGPLAEAGYHVVAPDYRGAGYSSKPPSGFTKEILAQDLHRLMTESINTEDKSRGVHVVGHDIGGMIAHAYAAQFSKDVLSVTWGECPLPGTTQYDATKHDAVLWHFDFHAQTDLAESLVSGKEKMYIKHFYDRLAQNARAFSNDDLDFYATQYAMPGALRCAFTTYKLFEADKVHNQQWREKDGKVQVKAMVLSGEHSFIAEAASDMANEYYENVRAETVEGSGHWLAEENPEDFVRKVLGFIES